MKNFSNLTGAEIGDLISSFNASPSKSSKRARKAYKMFGGLR